MDLVSVIVPCFNSSETLLTAVMSALDQSYEQVEVIVCDDGSTDTGLAVLAGIKDPRLKTIRNASNIGVGASRDRAIASSSGRWVAVLDADDAFRPTRIERMLEAAAGEQDVIVFDDIEECIPIQGHLRPIRRMRGRSAYGPLAPFVDVPIAEWLRSSRLLIKPLIPVELINKSGTRHSELPYAEDAEFFIKLMQAGGRLRYVPEALYLYRMSTSSASSNPLRHDLMIEVLEKASAGFSGEQEALQALREKVRYEEFLRGYFRFLRELKSSNRGAALRVLISNPRYIREMAARSIRMLHEKIIVRRNRDNA